jgi:hypothetical protein
MTPKEKAQELVEKFRISKAITESYAKQCAIIAVDEILKMVDESMQGFLDSDIIAYWKQVKTEIEKL